jgi:hypothetical protein
MFVAAEAFEAMDQLNTCESLYNLKREVDLDGFSMGLGSCAAS